jgi:hypothetical protein
MTDDNVLFSYTVEDGIEDGHFTDLTNTMKTFMAMDHNVAQFKFDTGRIVATPGIMRLFEAPHETRSTVAPLLARHLAGDWGDVAAEDKQANDRDLANKDGRLLSSYMMMLASDEDLVKIWIITEPGVTTILLPEEY